MEPKKTPAFIDGTAVFLDGIDTLAFIEQLKKLSKNPRLSQETQEIAAKIATATRDRLKKQSK